MSAGLDEKKLMRLGCFVAWTYVDLLHNVPEMISCNGFMILSMQHYLIHDRP
jgi:hypothetical protein